MNDESVTAIAILIALLIVVFLPVILVEWELRRPR